MTDSGKKPVHHYVLHESPSRFNYHWVYSGGWMIDGYSGTASCILMRGGEIRIDNMSR